VFVLSLDRAIGIVRSVERRRRFSISLAGLLSCMRQTKHKKGSLQRTFVQLIVTVMSLFIQLSSTVENLPACGNSRKSNTKNCPLPLKLRKNEIFLHLLYLSNHKKNSPTCSRDDVDNVGAHVGLDSQ
jgi:hypothetical protein